jgi:parallel beta-helix repeat protein
MKPLLGWWLFFCFLLIGCGSGISAGSSLLNDFGDVEPVSSGRTLYVSDSGDNNNDGLSETTAFRDIAKAAYQTKPGDTVLVMNGTYKREGTGNNVVEIRIAGEPDNYITYKAYPGHKPVIKVDNHFAGIKITAPYIVVDGFTVEGNAPNLSFDEANRLARGSDGTAALNNSLYNSGGIMSYTEGAMQPHHLIIRNNTVFNHPGSGIAANGSDYIRIENNVVYNNSKYSAYATSGISFYKSIAIDDKTDVKMWVRNNEIYKNENLVPFWYSHSDPAQRKITDGNGIIVDDSRNTQGDGGVVYNGTFLLENNIIYDNGGRGINVYSSDNVIARHNTTYQNGRTEGFTEIMVGDAKNVEFSGNIFVPRPDRETLLEFNTSDISFDNNFFSSVSETANTVSGSLSDNLIKNGTFDKDLSSWQLAKTDTAGQIKNFQNDYDGNCVYLKEPSQTNSYDVYLYQKGLELQQGANYALNYDVVTSNQKDARFTVKLGGSSGSFKPYAGEEVKLPTNEIKGHSKTLSFTMGGATDNNAQLEFQIAGNAEPSYFCFDNIVLTQSGGGSSNPETPQVPDAPQTPETPEAPETEVPQTPSDPTLPEGIDSSNMSGNAMFVNASTNPATADFSLLENSPAVDAQTEVSTTLDITKVKRPQGDASDLGAYESH